ncbi:MAG: yteA family sporulation protein, partial [Actinobacteria bacterium]|nr:yteA family sporulation protein [Actinomycetota bacterium]
MDLARQRLADERERLDEVRSTFDAEGLTEQSESDSVSELSSYDQHQADLGTETFEREKDLSILEQVEAELADVEH